MQSDHVDLVVPAHHSNGEKKSNQATRRDTPLPWRLRASTFASAPASAPSRPSPLAPSSLPTQGPCPYHAPARLRRSPPARAAGSAPPWPPPRPMRMTTLPQVSSRFQELIVTRIVASISNSLTKLLLLHGVAADLRFERPLKVVQYPDPVLRTRNKRINTFDGNLRSLADEMFDVMYK